MPGLAIKSFYSQKTRQEKTILQPKRVMKYFNWMFFFSFFLFFQNIIMCALSLCDLITFA